jgi:hypothetical protein
MRWHTEMPRSDRGLARDVRISASKKSANEIVCKEKI